MNIEKKDSFSFSLKTSLPVLIFALLVFSIMVITSLHYVRLTADSMLYFSLAKKYLSGDISNAINGYWGPLLAWLLVPFLYFGASDVFAINALNLVLGVCIIIGIWRMSYVLKLTEMMRSIILISLIPIVLKFSLVQPMDTLLVCILIYYLLIIFRDSYSTRLSNGLFSGILGALAYFSKAYAFPFFIVHFFAMNVLHYLRNTSKPDRMNVVKNTIAGFVIFFLISGIWIVTISSKYGHYTFSTMRQTNFNSPDPESMGNGLEFGVPIFSEGFYEPPNKTAFVIWEDPSYLRGKPWSAWESWYYFKHFIRLMLKNISDGLGILESFSALSVATIILCILLLIAHPVKTWPDQSSLLYPLLTITLYSGGYVLFHLEERYLWLTNVLLLLMGGYVLDILLRNDFFDRRVRRVFLISVFLISFTFVPSKYIIQVRRGEIDTDMHLISTDLMKYNISGNIASNREYVPVTDAWHKTFRLAYWLGDRYYGQAKANISDDDLEKELMKYDINYYFFWGDSCCIPHFLTQYKELTNGEIPDLKVFSLRERRKDPVH